VSGELSPVFRVLAAVLGLVILSALISAIWRRARKPVEGASTDQWEGMWHEVVGGAVAYLMIGGLLGCLLAEVVSTVWLMVKGEWWLLLGGPLAMVAMALVYPLAMLPTLPFMYGAAYFIKRREAWAAAIVALPGCVYQAFAAVIWAGVVFQTVVAHARPQVLIPAVIWGFAVAVGPLVYMMRPSQSRSDSSWIGTMLGVLSYWTAALLYWSDAPPSSVEWAALSLVALGTVLTTINLLATASRFGAIGPDGTSSAPDSSPHPLSSDPPTGHARKPGSALARDHVPAILTVEPWSVSGNGLHDAARLGDAALVTRLLAEGGADVRAADHKGRTALHGAALKGQREVVELLLERGAEINAQTTQNATPLHWAAARGHYEVVELLLDRGADINAEGADGGTPLHCAALEWGNRGVAVLLLKRGAEISAKDNKGGTPLHWAAYWGQTETAALLLERRAEINARTNEGQTPLHAAADHREMVELLLECGAKVDARNSGGGTPLHAAATEGHREVVLLLMERGANIDAVTEAGWTPLYAAAVADHREVVVLLLERGADLHARDIKGFTPLHWAVWKGYREVALLLLERGAQVNARTNQGWTPLQIVALEGRREVVELLLQWGAEK